MDRDTPRPYPYPQAPPPPHPPPPPPPPYAPTPGDQINQLHEELMLIHSSVATIYENMVSLDTALEYQGRHEVIISVARQTATVTMSIIQSIYPIVSSMNYKLHVLGGIF
ncbi:hypothetical protein HDV57DRAFT_492014 [Trichoderma longibrachiatum]|uniref:Uncharacterized protein n=1 Tax=Trichoderma longibrachiatum ATCC 18648 TaxID=983965 RepID=A0A2T4C2Q2_TRILO|nr:hypothetical protein M440DRAFT_5301 [Trichoderma longibrachiatum ATCC 18648]